MDFFVVPTARFQVLYVLVIIWHETRQVVHSNVTRHPTARWTAPRSPWHNPYVERLIGSIRRDCLNNMIVLNEGHLKRILKGYFDYYHRTEPISALAKKRQQADQCWKSLTTPKCLLSHALEGFTIGMNGRMLHKNRKQAM